MESIKNIFGDSKREAPGVQKTKISQAPGVQKTKIDATKEAPKKDDYLPHADSISPIENFTKAYD